MVAVLTLPMTTGSPNAFTLSEIAETHSWRSLHDATFLVPWRLR